ncbi:sensor histidine kinase [Catenulispora rubra]|uniref:sensor histidine kinase n=1 Tax=Catenulispora rubra TaxID=280293 RepID=UPI0018924A5F|nr:histidine kinase [Catenulispora rubra]
MSSATVPEDPGSRRGLRAVVDAPTTVSAWLSSPGMKRFLQAAGMENALRRAQQWAAAHPTTVDSLSVAAVLVPFSGHLYLRPAHQPVLGWILMFGFFLPLALRRRYPTGVFAVVAAFAFGQWAFDMLMPQVDFAPLIALYSIAAHAPIRRTLAAIGVMEIGAVMVAASWSSGNGTLRVFVFVSGMVTAAAVLGVNTRTRRAYFATLEERARRLEFERDQQAQIAAASERASIAREVHDVVTHSLSVMVALTDGASYAVHTSPDRAAEAVAKASEVGRQAITDMQRVLGVLRGSAGATMAELHPQPGLAQLDTLLAEVRVAGLPVELVVSGVRPDLSSGVELAVFRVVQEALTNTRKHAEPGASARVRLDFGQEAIEVTVLDDGNVAANAAAALGGGTGGIGRISGIAGIGELGEIAAEAGGHGIAGMKERVAAFGGELEAGPRGVGRGWRVHARVPVTVVPGEPA